MRESRASPSRMPAVSVRVAGSGVMLLCLVLLLLVRAVAAADSAGELAEKARLVQVLRVEQSRLDDWVQRLTTALGRLDDLISAARQARAEGLKRGFPVRFAGRDYPSCAILDRQIGLLEQARRERGIALDRMREEQRLLGSRLGALEWAVKAERMRAAERRDTGI